MFSQTGRRVDWKRLSSSVSSCLPLCYLSLLMYICLSRRPPVMPRSNQALMERDGAAHTLLRLGPINGARLSGHSAVCGRRWWRGRRKWGLGVLRWTRASSAVSRGLQQNVCLRLVSAEKYCQRLSIHNVGGHWSLSVVSVTHVASAFCAKPFTCSVNCPWPT